ncbi:homeobox domain-containing protein [Diplodia corticola]|uniref:Homeobox domain-containing protein n=1 Tax=Diplodia corticola TaxID=236234 RepID=A0A1J9RBQ8_9PEZI|nr:homeobox domain-containing protein [Diplodia corticola]OJD37586.1 homeobox domain-containing protein [Diplodia corticola]
MDRYPQAMPPYANAQQPGDAAASHPPNPHPHTLLKVSSEPNVRLHQPPVHPVCQEVKPRLTKEQHDILEAHFQQQHKPSTTTKKGFAESLGVPLEKINNWFQNRRAKVKQDMKKQMAQYNMHVQMQPQQHPPQQQQQQQQPQMPQQQIPMHTPMQAPPQSAPQSQPQRPDFSYGPPDMSSSSLPGNGFAVQQAPEMMAPQMPPQDYSSSHGHHALSSISESAHPGSFDVVMQSLVNAGYPVQASSANGMPPGLQPTEPFASFDGSSVPHSMGGESHFAFADFSGSDPFGDGLGDYGADHFDYSTLASSAPASFSGHNARASASIETSPYSAGQSLQNGGSSATSVQSGWMDDAARVNQREDSQEGSICGSVPGPGGQWMANHFQPQGVYQQSNTSNQTLISTAADPSEASMYQFGHPDFNPPFPFSDEALHRRDSPATALAQSMGNVEIQGQSNGDFKQPDQPSSTSSSIATRRQRPRPAALGQAALRSASYSAGMPSSPGANSHNLKADHTLRRIRSTGLVNSGRIQKANAGSAQRSPMHFTFAEAAVSPKFTTSTYGGPSISGPPVSTGSLAPPTPLTPSEAGRFPSWQSPGNVQSSVTSNQDTTSRADGTGVLYSMAPTSAAFSTASPPETPLSLASLYGHRARVSNGSLVRDTPPQSAPAQQQSFPRSAFAPQQTSMAEEAHQQPQPHQQPHPHPQPQQQQQPHLQVQPQQHHLHHHQSMENTHSQLMMQQHAQRRPSLPEGVVPYDMAAMQYAVPMVNADGDLQMAHPMQFAQDPSMNYGKQSQPTIAFSPDMGNSQMQHHMGMHQPSLYVHHYSPPDGSSGHGGQANSRRPSEMQPKSYIFANQTPGDFKA